MSGRRRLRDDRGSMIPLVLGFLLVTTMLLTVVTDVGSMWLARRSLQATLDGAALAGSRAVDLQGSTQADHVGHCFSIRRLPSARSGGSLRRVPRHISWDRFRSCTSPSPVRLSRCEGRYRSIHPFSHF